MSLFLVHTRRVLTWGFVLLFPHCLEFSFETVACSASLPPWALGSAVSSVRESFLSHLPWNWNPFLVSPLSLSLATFSQCCDVLFCCCLPSLLRSQSSRAGASVSRASYSACCTGFSAASYGKAPELIVCCHVRTILASSTRYLSNPLLNLRLFFFFFFGSADWKVAQWWWVFTVLSRN